MSAAISFESADSPPLPIHRFSVDDYHRLGELGVLTPEDRVELLEGWIVEKMNQRPAHGCAVGLLTQWLLENLPSGWTARCQLPITTERSEPEPDIAVVRGTHSDYRERHPRGDDCRLVIEVADTSLAKDRAKASIYSAAGVEEYWIVNLLDEQVERYFLSPAGTFEAPVIVAADDVIETQVADKLLRRRLQVVFT